MAHIIDEIYPLSDYKLLAVFSNGIKKIYDVKLLFEWKEAFKELKDNNLFEEAYVDVGGYGVVWNDQIDLSSEEIWNCGVDVSFNEEELDLFLADEALKQYSENSKTYSHKEIKELLVNEKPNKETQKAFEEVEAVSSGKQKAKKYKSASELRKELKV